MKKEYLARSLVILFILVAVTIPFAGQWLSGRNQPAAIELHARMPENGGWSPDTIQAEVSQPIHLHITSDDVVHGFAIGKSDQPALEIIPGEFIETTLIFDKPGKYTFYCNRWCGPNHWRMRGTIEVSGTGTPLALDPQPLFLKLGIDIDAPQPAKTIPSKTTSAERGAQFAGLLPAYAKNRDTYLSTSPENLWLRLRAEATLSNLSDNDLWDAVTWIWLQQTTMDALANGQKLFANNCAACHGETGKGDGVMVRGLPVWNPGLHSSGDSPHLSTGEGFVSPPDFTDPKNMLGASPALLEGKIIRGGMGTGMPYWGPIFTAKQIEDIVSYIYTFVWGFSNQE
ncbi:MAG: cytochrome c oxidase subunit II [Chloroflexi bacterium]|nr:MAG: cytochrome c oxidase subunit II [Chloroflexota bacterium]